MSEFEGFKPSLFTFLHELEANNEREWFNENKQRYEDNVREPTLAFIRAMEPTIKGISEHFIVDDRKSGGSMMRPYRDTRFSKDKTPYKTNVGVQFRHEEGKDVHAPGFYLHIEDGDCWFGIGLWRPQTDVLTQIRQKIVDESDRWTQLITDSSHAKYHEEGGESLKRAPKGFDNDHPMIEQLKRKSFIASSKFDQEKMFSPDFLDFVGERFGASSGYIEFLCEAVGIDF